MLLPSFDKVATPLRKGARSAAGAPAAIIITPSSTTGREDSRDLVWSLASSGGGSGGGSASFSDDALLSPTSAERSFVASTSFDGRKDARSLVLLAQYKLSRARLSLELALRAAKDIASEADEPMAAPSPRRDVPVAHSIEEEINLRLVADLVLTPGKTLTLSPY